MDEAYPQWPTVLWIGLGVTLLIFTWRGWRLGLVRAVLSSITLIVAGLLGWMIGEFAAEVLGAWLPWSVFLTRVGVAVGLALCAYFVVAILSGLLLKKTKDHESRIARGFFGLGGAVVGLLTGGLVIGSAIWVMQEREPIAQDSTNASPETPAATIGFENSYQIIDKLTKVTRDPKAMERFLEYPGIQRIVTHPKIVELTSNPDINEAAMNKNYLAILSNPAVIKAVADPALAAELKKVDLEKALDHALKPKKSKD